MNLQEKCRKIKVVALDVDGVLTDGSIGYFGDSGQEVKFFHARDGHGIRLALRAGLKVGIISGRKSLANEVRAKELELSFLYQGCKNKRDGFEQMIADQKIMPDECLYVGDDLIDLPPMRMAGIAVAVGDAVPELDSVCHFRTKAFGGRGAVRETMEWLLKEQGKWDALMQRYFA